jgi:hypothetical protein
LEFKFQLILSSTIYIYALLDGISLKKIEVE